MFGRVCEGGGDGKGRRMVSLTSIHILPVTNVLFPKYRKCPNCKTLRKATKQLSLSRLPPVLLIHLKRFSFKGPFTDKLETVVDFPLRGLDLTNYMPPPLPPGADKSEIYGGQVPRKDDPRTQMPPYRYDLYAVTNHFGSLTSGHCKLSSQLFPNPTTHVYYIDRYLIHRVQRRLAVL